MNELDRKGTRTFLFTKQALQDALKYSIQKNKEIKTKENIKNSQKQHYIYLFKLYGLMLMTSSVNNLKMVIWIRKINQTICCLQKILLNGDDIQGSK